MPKLFMKDKEKEEVIDISQWKSSTIEEFLQQKLA